MCFSCCDEPRIAEAIAVAGKDNIIIAGIGKPCLRSSNGHRPEAQWLLSCCYRDCISSRKENDKKMAVERMRSEGAIITTCESILFELLRYSGTEQFKAISRLVK